MMSELTRDELLRLFDANDILALSTRVNRELIRQLCPGGVEYGVLSAHIRDGLPDLHIPVITAALANPKPFSVPAS